MSNGTTQRLQFKPRKATLENRPDAPEGGWKFLIPKGSCKVTATSKGDPQLIIPHKLVEALDEKNDVFQGSQVAQRVIFFDEADPERLRASNMSKDRLRHLCTAVDVEFADVYPTEINDASSFDALIKALEGTQGTCWTVHTSRQMDGGEMVTDTEIRYREPKAGLVTKGAADDDNDERPSKMAAGSKSKKGASRR